MGVCASKPKTKDDVPRERKPETPRNRKLVGTGGQGQVTFASNDNVDDAMLRVRPGHAPDDDNDVDRKGDADNW